MYFVPAELLDFLWLFDIVHSLPLILRRTDYMRDTSHWFSRQPWKRKGQWHLLSLGRNSYWGVDKMLTSPLKPAVWSPSLDTGYGSFSQTHLLEDIPHLEVSLNFLSWVSTSVLWKPLTTRSLSWKKIVSYLGYSFCCLLKCKIGPLAKRLN